MKYGVRVQVAAVFANLQNTEHVVRRSLSGPLEILFLYSVPACRLRVVAITLRVREYWGRAWITWMASLRTRLPVPGVAFKWCPPHPRQRGRLRLFFSQVR